MNFKQKIESRYSVVSSEVTDSLKNVEAVKAAMKDAFPSDGSWENRGDVNPAQHGGHFFRLKGGNVEIVETSDYTPDGKNVYIITDASVSAQDIADKGSSLISFTGASGAKSLAELIDHIMTGWIPYYGGDGQPLEVEFNGDDEEEAEETYWNALKRFGIKKDD